MRAGVSLMGTSCRAVRLPVFSNRIWKEYTDENDRFGYSACRNVVGSRGLQGMMGPKEGAGSGMGGGGPMSPEMMERRVNMMQMMMEQMMQHQKASESPPK